MVVKVTLSSFPLWCLKVGIKTVGHLKVHTSHEAPTKNVKNSDYQWGLVIISVFLAIMFKHKISISKKETQAIIGLEKYGLTF